MLRPFHALIALDQARFIEPFVTLAPSSLPTLACFAARVDCVCDRGVQGSKSGVWEGEIGGCESDTKGGGEGVEVGEVSLVDGGAEGGDRRVWRSEKRRLKGCGGEGESAIDGLGALGPVSIWSLDWLWVMGGWRRY